MNFLSDLRNTVNASLVCNFKRNTPLGVAPQYIYILGQYTLSFSYVVVH